MARTEKHAILRVIHSYEEIPTFASEAEEAAFWATHTLDENLLGCMKPLGGNMLPTVRARTRPVSLRFDEDTLKRAKALAKIRHVGYQTLLKQFVLERLYEEEKREGLVG